MPARRARAAVAALLMMGPSMLVLAAAWAPAASAAAPDPAGVGATLAEPWWPAWLAAFDLDGTKVDDQAESVAAGHVAAGNPGALVPVMVSYGRYPGDGDRSALLGLGAADDLYTFGSIPTVSARVPASKVAGLGGLAGVVAVEYDYPVVAHLEISAPAMQAHDFEGTGADAVYNGRTAQTLGFNGEGMIVGVADTGVFDGHEAFVGKWVAGADTTLAGPPTYCVNPPDEIGHGTHVASTAVGDSPGATDGTARAARLVEVKLGTAATLTVAGQSIGSINRAFQFILDYNAAVDAGTPLCGVTVEDRVDVATLSFGSTGRGGPNAGTTEPLVTLLTQRGVVVTIAAGNCGPSPSSTCSFGDKESGVGSPANAAGAIAVANVNDRNTVRRSDDVLSSSSSRGPNSASTANNNNAAEGATSAANLKDRHRKPEVAAPGTTINAALNAPVGYIELSGTSMATPHVAGVAALLLQAGESVKAQTGGVNLMRPTGTGYNAAGAYVAGQHPVRDALIHSADYRTAGVPSDMIAKWAGPGAAGLTWNNGWGYGFANAFDAICWSFANVLVPGGASWPAGVQAQCSTPPPLEVGVTPVIGTAGTPTAIPATANGGTPPYTYAWTFGDGQSGAGNPGVNTYALPGLYTASVTVTDATSATATASAPITVLRNPLAPLGNVSRSYTWDSLGCADQEGWFQSTGSQALSNPLDGGIVSASGVPWHLTTEDAASAPCAWYHGVDGAKLYLDAQTVNLDSPGGDGCFFIPPGSRSATVAFDLAGFSELNYDFMWVQVRRGSCLNNVAETVGQAGTFVNYATYTGGVGDLLAEPPVYVRQLVALDDIATSGGGPFQVRFRVFTDNLIEFEGWEFDNFQVLLDNGAPSVSAPADFSTLTLDPVAFTVGTSDPDGDPLTLSASGLPEGASFDALSGAFSWVPSGAQDGPHTVTFTASDGAFQGSDQVTITVLNRGPVAAGSSDRVLTDRLTAVRFTDASSDPDGTIASRQWAFGDGATSTQADPLHTYASLGTFTPTLSVVDDDGAAAGTALPDITVVNLPPSADFTANPSPATRLEDVRFNAFASDRDGTVAGLAWDFNGDGITDSTAPSPSHRFTTLGAHTVRLTVTDNDGGTTVASKVVNVVNIAPSASFTRTPVTPMVGTPVVFQDTSTDPDGSVVARAWDFNGDGVVDSTGASAVHVYGAPGTYTVRLTVTDNDGGVGTATQTVVVCGAGTSITLPAPLDGVSLNVCFYY